MAMRFIRCFTTPYLADDDAVDRLAAAALRGVDVRVILPERNDSALMDDSNREAARTLLAAGARVYIYPGFTHAKAMLADGWAMFGSANMDWLNHAVNHEMDVATSDPEIAGRLKRDLFMAECPARQGNRPAGHSGAETAGGRHLHAAVTGPCPGALTMT